MNFEQKVFNYLSKWRGSFKIVSSQVLDDGMIAIEDDYAYGEIDTYFDTNLWDIVHPEIWGDCLFPGDIESLGFGILPGAGTFPQPTDFNEAEVFAKTHLRFKQIKSVEVGDRLIEV